MFSSPPTTDLNMVSSSEVRSSVQKARAAEVVKERALQKLKDAEGGDTVDAAVELHRKAILSAMADKLTSGVTLERITLDSIIDACETSLDVANTNTAHDLR